MFPAFLIPLYSALIFTENFNRTQEFRVVDDDTREPLAHVRVTLRSNNVDMLLVSPEPKVVELQSDGRGIVIAKGLRISHFDHDFRFAKEGYSDALVQVGPGISPEISVVSPLEKLTSQRTNGRAMVEVPLFRRRAAATTRTGAPEHR